MTQTRKLIDAPPEHVYAVLSDPPSYDRFVVGTKAIRHFDPRFPEPGSTLHHTVGAGPLILRDHTRVERADPPKRLVLRASMRPIAVNRVDFRLVPESGGTTVTVEEYPLDGPLSRIWSPPLEGLMWLRNMLMLLRLERLAKRRAEQAQMPGSPAPRMIEEPEP